MSEIQVAETIAKCAKCGRGFVGVNPAVQTDPFPDCRTWRDNPEPCGGKIEPLATPKQGNSR